MKVATKTQKEKSSTRVKRATSDKTEGGRGEDKNEGECAEQALVRMFEAHDKTVRLVVVGAIKEHHEVLVAAKRIGHRLANHEVPVEHRTGIWRRFFEHQARRYDIFHKLHLCMALYSDMIGDSELRHRELDSLPEPLLNQILQHFEFVGYTESRCEALMSEILDGMEAALGMIGRLETLQRASRVLSRWLVPSLARARARIGAKRRTLISTHNETLAL